MQQGSTSPSGTIKKKNDTIPSSQRTFDHIESKVLTHKEHSPQITTSLHQKAYVNQPIDTEKCHAIASTSYTLQPTTGEHYQPTQNPYTFDIDEIIAEKDDAYIPKEYFNDVKKLTKYIDEDEEDDRSVKDEDMSEFIYSTFLKKEIKEMKSARDKIDRIIQDLNPVINRLREKLQDFNSACTTNCKVHLQKGLSLKKKERNVIQVTKMSIPFDYSLTTKMDKDFFKGNVTICSM